MRLPLLHRLLIGQNKVVLQEPESLPVLPIYFSHEWLGVVLLGHLQVLAPDDVLGQAGFGAEDGVQDQARALAVVEGRGERLVGGVGDDEVLEYALVLKCFIQKW